MKSVTAAGILACGLLLVGCESSTDDPPDVNSPNVASGNNNPGGATPITPPAPTAALFQPLQGVLPFPTDIYFSSSTDGTLNIQPANALIPSQAALNALDGFSTNAVIRARFGSALNPASLNASTVRIFRIGTSNTTKAPDPGVTPAPLMFGTDFSAGVAPDLGVGPSILEIRPLRPLQPSGPGNVPGTGYLVVLTNGITTASGQAATPDADYAAFKAALAGGPTCPAVTNAQANLLCRLTGAHLQVAGAFGINPATVVLSFSFTTQATGVTMAAISANATAQPIGTQFSGLNTGQLGVPGLTGKADIHVGTLSVPYYLSRTLPTTGSWQAAPFAADPTSRFVTRFNPVPVATETPAIPLLVTVPNATSASGGVKPVNGWPVLIFQHGITRNRSDLFGVAEAFADAGFVVVGIDQPLHGITDPMSPLYRPGGATERTFDLDLVNNTSGAAGADGVIDSSGTHFIQLTSLLTSRDNARQAAADLITLTRSLPNLNLDANPGGDIDPTRVHFLGHSLGAIVGGVYLGVAPAANVKTATLAMPGGVIAQLLRDSPTFGPRILQGLAAQGLTAGSTLLEQFFRDAQTAIDAADPINYIAAAAAARPIHVIQVVGGGAVLPDQVVPNSATQRLVDAANLTRIPAPGAPGPVIDLTATGHRVYVNFIQGNHGSIIDPTASLAATTEMQTEAVSFAVASPNGTVIVVGNPAVIQP
ncbi:MAG: lipase [Steroidobacteraceae bacterium]